MKIDHVGYAVKRLDRAVESMKNLGFRSWPWVDDTDRNVRIAFCEKDGYRVELVAPLDTGKRSPVDTYLKKNGPMAYHLCFETERFEEEVKDLEKAGFRIIAAPQEAVAFGGRKVAFLSSLPLGLMELVEGPTGEERNEGEGRNNGQE